MNNVKRNNSGDIGMRIHSILASVLIILLTSCAGYRVETLYDVEPYEKIHRMKGNFIPVDKKYLGPYGNMAISGEIRSKNNLENDYGLIVACLIINGLYIREQNSLILNIDGEQFQFNRRSQPYAIREVKMKWQKYILEYAFYDINQGILERLSKANEVSFNIKGKTNTIQSNLSVQNLQNFKTFYQEYVQN